MHGKICTYDRSKCLFTVREAHRLGYIADRWGLIALMEAASGRCPLASCSNTRQQDGKQPSLLHYQLHYITFRIVSAIAALSVFVPCALFARIALEHQQSYFVSRVRLPNTHFGIDADISRPVRVVVDVPCTEVASTDAAAAVSHSACLRTGPGIHSQNVVLLTEQTWLRGL